MFWELVLAVLMTAAADAPPDALTLKQAVEMALAGNDEIKIAAAQEKQAAKAVELAKARYIPTVIAGSGLAYTHGMPLSIGGSAPSLINVGADSLLFNLPHRYAVRGLQAESRAAGAAGVGRRDDVVWRTASTYLELDKSTRALEVARRETDSLKKLEALTAERVQTGVDIPAELNRAKLFTARNRQKIVGLEGQVAMAESTLKALLGVPEERSVKTVPDSFQPAEETSDAAAEQRAIARALEGSPEIRRLREMVTAKEAMVQSAQREKYPTADLVGQYALVSNFNGYADFYRRFERHNVEFGLSVRFPIFDKPRIDAKVGQAEAELAEARHNLENRKRNIMLEVRKLFQRTRSAEAAREVARLDLELARETTRVLLAKFEEGRTSSRELEQARLDESAKWNALLDSGFDMDRARLDLLKTTGEITKVLQ
jgi:outer membrane protein TolC